MPIRPQRTAALAADAERRWDEYHERAMAGNFPVPTAPDAVAALRTAFSFSDFVYRTALRYPVLVGELIESDALLNTCGKALANRVAGELSAEATETGLIAALRRIRNREMLGIAVRDLSGRADLEATLSDLSGLADAAIAGALAALYREHCDRFGTPMTANGTAQGLVIVAMGKLGAGELNFSSDVDLVFAYPETGNTDTGALSCDEFFTRLCRRLIHALSVTTGDGFAFRVDARLRPYGDAGPLAMPFDLLEDYYQLQGREWERYAWIKARVAAGDRKAGKQLMERLKPFVYRRYLDFGVFSSLRDMKSKIEAEVRRKGYRHNIKLGAGGIREIEFFGQVFQLLRGGVVPRLQDPRIRTILKALAEEGLIPPAVARRLDAAYVFLRHTENRLQAMADQQTHDLPTADLPRARLAAAMGFSGWEEFSRALTDHRNAVSDHFGGLLSAGESEGKNKNLPSAARHLRTLWDGTANHDDTVAALAELGFASPPAVARLLLQFSETSSIRTLSGDGKARLGRLMPLLLTDIADRDKAGAANSPIHHIHIAIQHRITYQALLIENPSARIRLVQLVAASPWIAAFLSQHPVLLDELLDPRTLYRPPTRTELSTEIKKRLKAAVADDFEQQIEALCIFRQVNTLRVAAADITGNLPLMRTSDHLTDIAEVVIEAVVALAWAHLVTRYGMPERRLNDRVPERGFAVVAYGKLGGIELGYGSDLDLVFLHAGTPGSTRGAANHPIDNDQFYARLGQRIIHTLTAHTRAGRLYEVDMRLRPSGSKGILVSHIEAFRRYQAEEAWTWEHQALVRSRAIAGDPLLRDRFEAIRREIICRRRGDAPLGSEVADMRQRMRKEDRRLPADVFDLKQGIGGMVDIEFLVQYLVLRHAADYPELARWSDNVRQLEALTGSGILDNRLAHQLRNAYLTYRVTAHRLSLQNQPATVPATRFSSQREAVSAIWASFIPETIS